MSEHTRPGRSTTIQTPPSLEEVYRRVAQLHYALSTADTVTAALHHQTIDDLMNVLEMLEPLMPPRAGHQKPG
jgi:hypothetical protein